MARRRYRRNPDVKPAMVALGVGVLGLIVYLISSGGGGATQATTAGQLNELLQEGDGNLPAGTVLPGGSVVLQ